LYYTEQQQLGHALVVLVLVDCLDRLSFQDLSFAINKQLKSKIALKHVVTFDKISSLSTIFTVFFGEENPIVFFLLKAFCSISGSIP